MNSHPFTVRDIGNRFERLRELLKKERIISINKCENSGIVLSLNKEKSLIELIFFSILLHSGFSLNKENKNLEIKGRGIDIHIKSAETNSILQSLLHHNEEILLSRAEELFNSLIAIYISSHLNGKGFCFKFLYPNAYIKEIKSNSNDTHEIDILGCITKNNENIYIMIETTSGYFKKESDRCECEKETHNWHFKKAIFKKWAIEKIFKIKINLIYITIRKLNSIEDENTEKDIFIEKILQEDPSIQIVSWLPHPEANIKLLLFSESNYMDNFNLIKEKFLMPIRECIENCLENPSADSP